MFLWTSQATILSNWYSIEKAINSKVVDYAHDDVSRVQANPSKVAALNNFIIIFRQSNS